MDSNSGRSSLLHVVLSTKEYQVSTPVDEYAGALPAVMPFAYHCPRPRPLIASDTTTLPTRMHEVRIQAARKADQVGEGDKG